MWPLPSAFSFRRAACQAVSILGLLPFVPTVLQASNGMDVPRDLPQLAREVSERARTWRSDAWLLRIEAKKAADTESADAFQLSFYVFSPSDRAGLLFSRRSLRDEDEATPYEVHHSGPLIPIPEFAVDLPQALMAAQKAGMRGQILEATLAVRTPLAKNPVLVWSVRAGDQSDASIYFIDAFTGAHLTSEQVVNGPVGADTVLDAAQRSLKEALQHSSPVLADSGTPWMHFVAMPILNAKNVFECNALGGRWMLVKMCLP